MISTNTFAFEATSRFSLQAVPIEPYVCAPFTILTASNVKLPIFLSDEFANWLLTYPDTDPQTEAAKYLNDDVKTVEDALNGAHEILAEAISEMSTVRSWLRNFMGQHGQLMTAVKRNGKEKD